MMLIRNTNLNSLFVSAVLICLIVFTSCSKDKDFEKFYGKSGIWEIRSLQVDYLGNNDNVDSSRTYSNCGMFIFYNVNIGAERVEYNGQYAVTTFTETHGGIAWYPENDNLSMKTTAAGLPVRIYKTSGKANKQTWTYTGLNNGFLPGNSPKVSETLTVERIKTK